MPWVRALQKVGIGAAILKNRAEQSLSLGFRNVPDGL